MGLDCGLGSAQVQATPPLAQQQTVLLMVLLPPIAADHERAFI